MTFSVIDMNLIILDSLQLNTSTYCSNFYSQLGSSHPSMGDMLNYIATMSLTASKSPLKMALKPCASIWCDSLWKSMQIIPLPWRINLGNDLHHWFLYKEWNVPYSKTYQPQQTKHQILVAFLIIQVQNLSSKLSKVYFVLAMVCEILYSNLYT